MAKRLLKLENATSKKVGRKQYVNKDKSKNRVINENKLRKVK